MISMKRGEDIMTTQRHGWWDMRLSVRQRSVLIGLVTALSSQLYFSAWVEGFRISASAILILIFDNLSSIISDLETGRVWLLI